MTTGFGERYGPWALVAGASDGLGAAFGRAIAARGLSVVLVARSADKLEALAEEIRSEHGVEARPVVQDLGSPDLVDALEEKTAGLEVGLVVYNAGLSIIGPFLDQPLENHLETLQVNCRGPLALTHHYGRPMARRGRGGIVLMSSLAGFQGSALVASYSASKAFDLVLGESLWEELREQGVDVLSCCAGATRTPNYIASEPVHGRLKAPEMEPEEVVEEALASLGSRACVVAGSGNRLLGFILHRLMPRSLAVRIMGASMRRMYPSSRS
ncbi:MAG: SDR family NAD(P)-dependent oxidoreductase [Deltaproteobacteria bacterium]|nr:SDR family NAD(P)-dependent oxidoreductase [Deltaproteobacteria bacterium]